MTVNTGGTAQDTIERLQAKIKELETPVLPDDVAKLCKELRYEWDPQSMSAVVCDNEAADLLERQVRDIAAYERYEKTMGKVVPELQQRIEELVDMHQECSKSLTTQVKRACKAEKRIEQLEAALKIIESEIMPEIPNSKGWQYTPAEVARAALQENE